MRASKTVGGRRSTVRRRQPLHISGAEGLFEFREIAESATEYLSRAVCHPRGMPDEVVITAERLRQKPVITPLLPYSTVPCESPGGARNIIRETLADAGISEEAMATAFRIVAGKETMRGASLVSAKSGSRLEPDKERGVRVSRLGISKSADRSLSRRLSRDGINTTTVKEALVLASKVASCKAIIAELCISDDPDYTTGYTASRKLGYVRIPHIKRKGDLAGGRVFFVKEGSDAARIVEYLERVPVMVEAQR